MNTTLLSIIDFLNALGRGSFNVYIEILNNGEIKHNIVLYKLYKILKAWENQALKEGDVKKAAEINKQQEKLLFLYK